MSAQATSTTFICLQNDEKFRHAYESASLVLADGMPVLWLSRLVRGAARLKERVAGSDLFWELAKLSHERGVTLFFLGGAPGAAEKAAEKARERFPQVKIVGTHCPSKETFDTAETQDDIRRRVRQARPDILLVGLGAPKQERWICRHRYALGVPVSIGVGGTFEMAGGRYQAGAEARSADRAGMGIPIRARSDAALPTLFLPRSAVSCANRAPDGALGRQRYERCSPVHLLIAPCWLSTQASSPRLPGLRFPGGRGSGPAPTRRRPTRSPSCH